MQPIRKKRDHRLETVTSCKTAQTLNTDMVGYRGDNYRLNVSMRLIHEKIKKIILTLNQFNIFKLIKSVLRLVYRVRIVFNCNGSIKSF